MARVPNEKAAKAEAMYHDGMKLVDIARKLDVPPGTVRRWKSTYHWDGNSKKKQNERSDNKSERSDKSETRHRGGQIGNNNALKNATYASEYWKNISDEERPVAIQIYGKDTETMVEAARIVEEARPDILDINFGCPVKRVAGKGAGAGMLQNIPKMLEITRAVVDAVKIPVTVKTRLGWDANNKIIVELAEQLQDCGIAALTIHGRTRAQMYTGEADWTLIGEVKKNPRMYIPIIGNGDITSPQRAKECFDLYGVDAIMIGRASFGRPWIFKEVRHYLETGEELPPLSADWKLSVLRQEVVDSVNLLDERRGILHVRRHLAASPLFKGIPNFRESRIAMLRAETKEELFRIFDDITPILHSPA